MTLSRAWTPLTMTHNKTCSEAADDGDDDGEALSSFVEHPPQHQLTSHLL